MRLDTKSRSSVPAASNRIRRERSLGETAELDHLIAELCEEFIRSSSHEIDEQIDRWLKRIVRELGLDRSGVSVIGSLGLDPFNHAWARDEDQIIPKPLDANALWPWLVKKLMAGETVVIPSLDELPEEAAVDRESFSHIGTKSNVTIPIQAGGEVVGGVGFATLNHERKWPPRIVKQLELVAQTLGYALERKKRAAEVQKLRDELTHISRITALGELAASLVHELNQPLTAISSNTEAAQLLLDSERPNLEEVRQALQEVVRENLRARDIIGHFRQLFKRRELAKSTVAVDDLFDAVARTVGPSATIKGISLTFHSAPSLPSIKADPVLMQQVLINLIMNASHSISAVAEGPRRIKVRAFPGKSGFLNFSVSDTGIGMEPHLISRLFESFFTTKPGGLGLGLTIAQSIVEAHGGRICARQNAKRGATFEFTLPIGGEP